MELLVMESINASLSGSFAKIISHPCYIHPFIYSFIWTAPFLEQLWHHVFWVPVDRWMLTVRVTAVTD